MWAFVANQRLKWERWTCFKWEAHYRGRQPSKLLTRFRKQLSLFPLIKIKPLATGNASEIPSVEREKNTQFSYLIEKCATASEQQSTFVETIFEDKATATIEACTHRFDYSHCFCYGVNLVMRSIDVGLMAYYLRFRTTLRRSATFHWFGNSSRSNVWVFAYNLLCILYVWFNSWGFVWKSVRY